jgi:type I restriction enzyme S subunit
MKWPSISLGEVASLERRSLAPEQIESGTNYLGLEHIESGGRIIKYQSVESGELKSNKFIFDPETLLYGKLRPYLAKVCIPDREGCCSTDIIPIRPGKRLDIGYLRHLLLWKPYVDKAASLCSGANLPRISPSTLLEIEIPLPPLEEQRRIAAILDKASTVKRQSAKALALTETLCIARLEQLLATNKGLLVTQRLEELCVTGAPITYGILQPGPDLNGGVPYVRPSEIKNSQIDLGRLKRTSLEIARKYSKSQLNSGDILLTIVGTIGEAAIVPPELEGGNITQSSARIRIDPDLANPLYVYHFLKSQHVSRQIERDRLGVAVERLNLHHVRDIEILCLPRDIQEKFAAEADSLKQLASRHSRLVKHANSLLGSYSNSLLGSRQGL